MLKRLFAILIIITTLPAMAQDASEKATPNEGGKLRVENFASEPVDNGNGTFTVTYLVRVNNEGTATVYDLDVIDDLTDAYGSHKRVLGDIKNVGEYTITSGPIFKANAKKRFRLNKQYNGDTNNKLLNVESGGALAPSEKIELRFNVVFMPALERAPYENLVIASGDYSQDGTADDEIFPETEFTSFIKLKTNPQVNIEKQIAKVFDNNNGTFDITYRYVATNEGNVNLYDLKITENLKDLFGKFEENKNNVDNFNEYSISSAPKLKSFNTHNMKPNQGYNGKSDNEILAKADGAYLPVGESIIAEYTVRIFPESSKIPYVSNVKTSASYGNEVTNKESASVSLDIELKPIIGASLNVEDITDNKDGTFTAEFAVLAKNYGTTPLHNLTIEHDIANVLGRLVKKDELKNPSEYTIISAPTILTNSKNKFNANPEFNGLANNNLIASQENSLLHIDESVELSYKVKFIPEIKNQPFASNAVILASVNKQAERKDYISDISTAGLDPDEQDGNGIPNENIATDIELPYQPEITLVQNISEVKDNADATFSFNVKMKGENTGNVALYDTQITNSLKEAFGSHVSLMKMVQGSYTIVQSPTSNNEKVIINNSYNGDTDANLLALSSEKPLMAGEKFEISYSIDFFPNPKGKFAIQPNISSDIEYNGIANSDVEAISPNLASLNIPFISNSTIAKSYSIPSDNEDGTFDINITYLVKNTGNTLLNNLSIEEDLASIFGELKESKKIDNYNQFAVNFAPSTNNVDIKLNPLFNGVDQTQIFANDSKLKVSENAEIKVGITFYPDLNKLPFASDAVFTSEGEKQVQVSSNVVNMDFIPVNPSIDIAKTSKITNENKETNEYEITTKVSIMNTGNTPLGEISVIEDMATAFGKINNNLAHSDTYKITAEPKFTKNSTNEFTLNSKFNGSTDKQLFDFKNSGELAIGEELEIEYSYQIKPDIRKKLFATTPKISADLMTNYNDQLDMDTENQLANNDIIELPDRPLIALNGSNVDLAQNKDDTYSLKIDLDIANSGNVNLDRIEFLNQLEEAVSLAKQKAQLDIDDNEGISLELKIKPVKSQNQQLTVYGADVNMVADSCIEAHGVIFADENNDKIQQEQELGLANVAIFQKENEITRTYMNGEFEIDCAYPNLALQIDKKSIEDGYSVPDTRIIVSGKEKIIIPVTKVNTVNVDIDDEFFSGESTETIDNISNVLVEGENYQIKLVYNTNLQDKEIINNRLNEITESIHSKNEDVEVVAIFKQQ